MIGVFGYPVGYEKFPFWFMGRLAK
jgi:hypothetical protein